MLIVDGVNGAHQPVSFVTVNGVEQVPLHVTGDFRDDNASLLVLVSRSKDVPQTGQGIMDNLQRIVRRYRQIYRYAFPVLGEVFPKTVGLNEDQERYGISFLFP